MRKSEGEEYLYGQIQLYRLPLPEREYRFAAPRKFRFDFAYVPQKLAIEVEGGIWMKKGGHNTAKGIQRDMEKQNLAVKHGWRVLRFTTQQVKSGMAVNTIADLLRAA